MPFQIDEAILRRTTKCQRNFVCLTEEGCPGCEFDGPISDTLNFVIPKKTNIECPYKLLFGFDSYVCQCPTRNELYRKYKK